MRIIAGKWKGRPLLPPPGPQTRPILDHVKEALFNILGAHLATPGTLPPCHVLDLFCGTGSLGLEALSRGAEHCVFVDRHRATLRCLGDNVKRLDAASHSTIFGGDAWRPGGYAMLLSQALDVVFVDPPYADAEMSAAGQRLPQLVDELAHHSVTADGLMIIRHSRRSVCAPEAFARATLVDQRRYGGMTLSMLQPLPGG